MTSVPMTPTPEATTKPPGGPLSKLSDGERQKLMLLGANLLILGLALGIYFFNQSLKKTDAEIQRYRQTLDALAQAAPKVAEAKAKEEATPDAAANRFATEVLTKNDLRLASFVSSHATAADIKIDSYDEDTVILSSNKETGASITERIIKLTINEAEFDKLLNLLERIETSPEPVVVKLISVRAKNAKNNTGSVRAVVHVSTYVQKL
jgi:type II secretory pathway component PulM